MRIVRGFALKQILFRIEVVKRHIKVRAVAGFVTHYNTDRLHSAVGYVTPHDKLEGRAEAIHADRDRKLAAAREARRQRRRAMRLSCASESGSRTQTYESESPCSSVASASPHPVPGGVEAAGRKGRPPAVPDPRPSTPAGGEDENQGSRHACAGELLTTMDGLSNSR